MCGIAGFISTSSVLGLSKCRETITSMLDAISHRGPDQAGYLIGETFGIGSVRLSILDVERGVQPLTNEAQTHWIFYNGEVYNFIEIRRELETAGWTFDSDSDTEVVLKAWLQWGEEALQRFNGGYAICIFQPDSNTLLLARDRLGKRPLFYAHNENAFHFASEMKALLPCDTVDFAFDPNAIATTFRLWTPLPDQTPFQGVRQLPPGHFAVFKNGDLEIKQYWDFPPSQTSDDMTEESAAESLRARLAHSVQLRLRSDVEVGTYLSGGVDSTITTHLAKQYAQTNVQTFSVTFNSSEHDESREQELASKALGTRHHNLRVNNRMLAESFPDAVWHAELPLFRTALTPLYLLSRLVRDRGIKVVLTGEGADEVFLGYNIFKETILRERWGTLSTEDKKRGISQLYHYLKHFSHDNIAALLSVFEQNNRDLTSPWFSHALRYNLSSFSLRLLDGDYGDGTSALEQYLENVKGFSERSCLDRAQYLEVATLLSGYLLSSQGDRMSLANGVENRCPYLDTDVVELASRIPTPYKLTKNFSEKHILRKAFHGELPEELITRPKVPYRAPDAEAFLGNDAPPYLDSVFSSTELKRCSFLDHTFCDRLVAKVRKSHRNRISPRENQAFLNLLSLMLLRERFVEGRDIPPPKLQFRGKYKEQATPSGTIVGNTI